MTEKTFCVSIGDKIFYYSGNLIEETGEYVVLDDIKVGRLKLFKKNVVWIKDNGA